MRQAEASEAAKRRQAGRQGESDGGIPPMGWKEQAEAEIGRLEAQGITQVTEGEFKVMSAAQRVQARQEGRLQRIMLTPAHDDGIYRTSTAG
jgi:hypothetical protein